jgi:hypothetical protein
MRNLNLDALPPASVPGGADRRAIDSDARSGQTGKCRE